MLMGNRKRALRAVYEVLAVLDRLWDAVPVGDGSDPELDKVIAGPILMAESNLLNARFHLIQLINEEAEE